METILGLTVPVELIVTKSTTNSLTVTYQATPRTSYESIQHRFEGDNIYETSYNEIYPQSSPSSGEEPTSDRQVLPKDYGI